VNQRCQEIPLLSARYGEDSGIAGGAALCFDASQNNDGNETMRSSELALKR